MDFVEEAFDQPPAAGFVVFEEQRAALALDVENAAFVRQMSTPTNRLPYPQSYTIGRMKTTAIHQLPMAITPKKDLQFPSRFVFVCGASGPYQ